MFTILFKHPTLGVCACDTVAKGKAWSYVYTEEQAKERVADLATVGVNAWYEETDKATETHIHQLQTW